MECPENSKGIHPKCSCKESDSYYNETEKICKSNIGRTCPKDAIGKNQELTNKWTKTKWWKYPNEIGVGPDCLCVRPNYAFIENKWKCVTDKVHYHYPATAECPGEEKWPQCEISIERNALLSLVGWMFHT